MNNITQPTHFTLEDALTHPLDFYVHIPSMSDPNDTYRVGLRGTTKECVVHMEDAMTLAVAIMNTQQEIEDEQDRLDEEACVDDPISGQ